MDFLFFGTILGLLIFIGMQQTHKGHFDIKSFVFNFSFIGFIPITLLYMLRLSAYKSSNEKVSGGELNSPNKQKNWGRYIELGFLLLLLLPFLVIMLAFAFAG